MPDIDQRMEEVISRLPRPPESTKGPLWQGPVKDGVTFSILSRYCCCKERFRVRYVEGLQPAPAFDHKIEFGQLWHVCERALASEVAHFGEVVGTTLAEDCLLEYARRLALKYPLAREQVDHWYNVVRVTFPLYVKRWAGHPDVKGRTPLLQEHPFDVPYRLPSGRTVRLRGRWDSVDLVGRGGAAGIWLQENKTKGDVVPERMVRQLHWDLQTMLYLVALEEYRLGNFGSPQMAVPTAGVRYNVVRRPLSGGKGSIKRGKGKLARKLKSGKVSPAKPPEPKDKFYARVAKYVADAPAEYFFRWNVNVTPADLVRFRRECLDPLLENLLDDYEWWVDCLEERYSPYDYKIRSEVWPSHRARHYREPYGLYDVVREGGEADVDEYLRTGSTAGLVRAGAAFPELEDEHA